MTSSFATSRPFRSLALLALAACFAVLCWQAPLYYSNQNQYFLHGLADAGVGDLRADWLANTRDPTPVFSALVAFTVAHLPPFAFHLYYALVQGAYALALFGLFAHLVGPEVAARRWPLFIALFFLAHSALLRWCSYRWLGQDYPWFLQSGVAGQYILGGMFQPSVFGVLLVVAIYLFARDRPLLAGLCAALAATLHSTYLLHAGLLVLGFMAAQARERRFREALATGALALAAVLPVTVFVLRTFGPTSPEDFARAQDILVNVRIPHHTRVDRWLDPVAVLQLAWLAVGLALTRPANLRFALVVPVVLATILTVVQVATGSKALALLFPWRLSAILVPVATTVILSRLVEALPAFGEGKAVRAAAGLIALACVVGGAWIGLARLGFSMSDEERPLLDFVRHTCRPGELYFLPVSVPDLTRSPRGSLSTDFKPLVDKRSDIRVIPVDLQRFRLLAGAPIYVDFKSIPYKDVEVIEWYDRLRLAENVQEQIRKGELSSALDHLRSLGVTHLVVPAREALEGPGLEQVHQDEAYRVYQLRSR